MSQKDKRKKTGAGGFLHSHEMQDATHGLHAEIIAETCGVDVATAYRWKSGKSKIPKSAAALLLGELGAFSKYWQGWRIQGESIISPDGWTIRRDDALAVPLMVRQIRDRDLTIQALEDAIQSLQKRIKRGESLDEQPNPGASLADIKA